MIKKYKRSKRSEILRLARDPMFRQRVEKPKRGAGSYKRNNKVDIRKVDQEYGH